MARRARQPVRGVGGGRRRSCGHRLGRVRRAGDVRHRQARRDPLQADRPGHRRGAATLDRAADPRAAKGIVMRGIVMRARGLFACVALIASLTAAGALAQVSLAAGATQAARSTSAPPPASPLDARLKKLELGLRCLVCQNQTLADSDAPLAADLRGEIRELAVAGKNDDDIRAFLTARYGDFVLYNPPVQPNTWLLWFGPFILLAAGMLVWWRMSRASGHVAADDPARRTADADASRGRALLESGNATQNAKHLAGR